MLKNRNNDNDNDKLQCFTKTLNFSKIKKYTLSLVFRGLKVFIPKDDFLYLKCGIHFCKVTTVKNNQFSKL